MDLAPLLRALDVSVSDKAGDLVARSPIDGSVTGRLASHDHAGVTAAIERAHAAFTVWRSVPAPRRGELIRLFGEELRASRDALATLVTIEAGKITAEARGEVQEMIDICDFACGLSRQLYGLTIASERPGHRMSESWHPLGVVGVISAFNFPVAVWAWNFALAVTCGDSVVWKPSEKTPLTALACNAIFERALAKFAQSGAPAPSGLSKVVLGTAAVGEVLVDDPRVVLVSATGSTRMGRAVAPRVAARFGRCLLELGGNNAMIVGPTADLELATRAILFSAAGTAGQRCTTLRRLIVHESIRADLVARVTRAYAQIRVGDPREAGTLVGPLIDGASFDHMQAALARAQADGGKVTGGERVSVGSGGYYVRPAVVEMSAQTDVVRTETFAPILYVMGYRELDQAIAMQNDVPQGLSSCIFTNDLREAERFLSATGSDCGIANVNIGPSGAEIGGAFGGEKETGGGRESGSDAWKSYMRRATNTVNYSTDLPLAQGITFG
ncbi:MAG: aldehyde dehydrogenase family protein [Kofleriaceae bacterium]|nr:aldehyde dehydrogenase family protein [Kofleriaceae bacterium]